MNTLKLAPMQDVQALEYLWREVEHFIDESKSAWQDLYTKESFHNGILQGDYHLWLLRDDQQIIAILITQFIKYPARRVGEVILAAGKGMLNNMSLCVLMEVFGAEFGATLVVINGRLGWKKALENMGYEMRSAVYFKEITKEMYNGLEED